jgi:type VI secretion system secreted protein VgrG
MDLQLSDRLHQLASRLDFAAFLDQRGRMLKLACALPELALVPERLRMREAVSTPFDIEVDCLSSSRHFELKRLIGEQITVSLLRADGRYAPWHGYVFEAAQLGADGGLARYRLRMQPWLRFLALRRDCYAFVEFNAVQIAEAIFADYPQANFRIDVASPPPVRPLAIQYNETDLDFLERVLAEAGLSYHFVQSDGEEAQEADRAGRGRHQLVITDRQAQRSDLGELRFTAQHVTAVREGQRDAITAFSARRAVAANAVTLGSWAPRELVGHSAAVETALTIGEVPTLEVYDGAGQDRYADPSAAERAADQALAAAELAFKRFSGEGSARHLTAGSSFSLVDHPLYGANRSALNYTGALIASRKRPDHQFTVIAVEHEVRNNLGAQIAELFGVGDLERGSYRNRFDCIPAAAAIVPVAQRKPTAPGLLTAKVVGIDGETLSPDRDLRIRIQFPWQRGRRPLAGGLAHGGAVSQTPGSSEAEGHAPADQSSLIWVRSAAASAGAHWGSAYVPRIGSEVAVQFIEGDIDRPVIVGQLYSGAQRPPWPAGEGSGANHPGTLSGIASRTLDGAGFNQWVIDDAPGQLRTRLASSSAASELSLGHLIQQGQDGRRGAWRGSGFELLTSGWTSVRAAQGLLVSSTARPGSGGSARSTQMDAAEALAQLRGAHDLGRRLDEAARSGGGLGLAGQRAGAEMEGLITATDPKQDGHLPEQVNGQSGRSAGADGRSADGESVAAFGQPRLLLDSASALLAASQADLMSMAGGSHQLIAQSDIQVSAAHNIASVNGRAASLYSQAGGVRVHAAAGPVSAQAHTDALELKAEGEVTIVSVNDEIRIEAAQAIELVAGQSRVRLDGGDVNFECPGTFSVKASAHAFSGGGGKKAALEALPDGLAQTSHWVGAQYLDEETGEPVQGAEYEIELEGGARLSGTLNAQGEGKHENVVNRPVRKITYQPRKADPDRPHPPLDELLG